eukprot:1161668-Pelagomonas_calceolata.AAC.5
MLRKPKSRVHSGKFFYLESKAFVGCPALWQRQKEKLCRQRKLSLHQLRTSEGSVASDAEKLAKPVLWGTEVALICSLPGATTGRPQESEAELPCLVNACMHA